MNVEALKELAAKVEAGKPDLNFRCCGCGEIWDGTKKACECPTQALYQRDGKGSRWKSELFIRKDDAQGATLIRSRAIKEFCDAAGIKASVQVKHLPDDVRRFRALIAQAQDTGEDG